jgi:hypothetical protein
MLRQHRGKNKSVKLRVTRKQQGRQRGSLRWCAEKLGVSASHLVRVRDGERPNVNNLLERYEQLKEAA